MPQPPHTRLHVQATALPKACYEVLHCPCGRCSSSSSSSYDDLFVHMFKLTNAFRNVASLAGGDWRLRRWRRPAGTTGARGAATAAAAAAAAAAPSPPPPSAAIRRRDYRYTAASGLVTDSGKVTAAMAASPPPRTRKRRRRRRRQCVRADSIARAHCVRLRTVRGVHAAVGTRRIRYEARAPHGKLERHAQRQRTCGGGGGDLAEQGAD
ncbi:hypothetical protein JKP88DRAFT_337615 [Tribonema minus]|uniref:Uncharacterized protein n=1 Tax=Tribonema minus TaxID=303371 RepID=A0A835YL24_9STRA|nr:hypothetical protein JKP88DRAFT_337615 [Tribonema minus]